MTRHNDNPEIDGAGPFRLQNDESIDPNGGVHRWPINSREYRHNGRKGFFTRYVPFDQALIKNKSTDSAAVFRFNGTYETEVEQSAADTFGEVGITRIEVENVGAASIDPGELVMMLKKDPYDADDAARERAKRGPIERMVRGTLNL